MATVVSVKSESATPTHSTSLLPPSFYREFLRALSTVPGVRFLTHSDLPFDMQRAATDEEDLRRLYAAEYRMWREQSLETPSLDIIVLHDADSGPEATVAMCEQELALGVRSTTSIFARRVGRDTEIVDYPIDHERLLSCQKRGTQISYHTNAFEIAHHLDAAVGPSFVEDLSRLRQVGYEVSCFSPHGGRPGPDGRNNNSFFYPAFADEPLVWTHNRFAPSGHRYSDGSLPHRLGRSDDSADLRAYVLEFLRKANGRGRLFLLLHPQYYFAATPDHAASFFEHNPWLEEAWKLEALGDMARFWESLRHTSPPSRSRRGMVRRLIRRRRD